MGLALLDELTSGVSSVGAPDIEHSLGSSHTTTALVLFVLPGVIAFALEPLIYLAADRYPRRHFVRAGVTAMAAGALASAFAPGPIALGIAFGLLWLGIGTASGLAQAMLIDARPDARGQTMARWTLLALAGDLLTPVLLAALAWLGGTWRTAYLVLTAVIAAWAIALWLAPLDDTRGDDHDNEANGPGMWASLKEALRDRSLVFWMFATSLCDLLDEILVVFASIHLRELGATAAMQSLVVGALMLGSAIGLVVLERLLKTRSERSLLLACSLACAVAYAAWLASPSVAVAAILMIFVGATSAPLYPLAAAQMYATRPEASGAVLAASHLFTPFGMALPFVIGALADRAGTLVALCVLLAQPLGLAALTIVSNRQKA